MLIKSYDIDFAENANGQASCTLKDKQTSAVILCIPEDDCLFPLKIEKQKSAALTERKEFSLSAVEEWHRKVGHPSAERYMKLSQTFDEVPRFDRALLQELQCVPCITAKQHKAPIRSSTRCTTAPLELVHLDISGKVEPSLSGAVYTAAFLDDFTAVSYVQLLTKKSELLGALETFKVRAEVEHKQEGHILKNIRRRKLIKSSHRILSKSRHRALAIARLCPREQWRSRAPHSRTLDPCTNSPVCEQPSKTIVGRSNYTQQLASKQATSQTNW